MNVPASDRPVVLFDGVCNLCNGVVRFIIARDPSARFRFAPLQWAVAGAAPGTADSIVLVVAGKRYTRSTAALRIARGLRFPWPLLYALVLVPRPLRDLVYDWVARHRYGWFGKRETCMVPTPEVRGRFLE
jgi:predicted DCC family thiol-disulfide oxidoreductase YuxK